MTKEQQEAHLVALWRADPIRFVCDNFGLKGAAEYREPVAGEPPPPECLDYFQEDFLRALLTHDRICQVAAKGPGKTAGEAWAVWWFMACFPLGRGAGISYTEAQLHANLWTELRKWQQRSAYLMERFEWTESKIARRGELGAEWKFEARSYPKTASAEEQATSLAGLHADAVMVVMDESGEIPVGVLKTAEGVLANKVHAYQFAWVIQCGNPSKHNGALHYAAKRPQTWHVQHITGDPADPKRARRISAAWVAELIRDHGRDHPITRINGLGLFPLEDSRSLIPASRVQAAQKLELPEEAYSYAPLVMGVDPARTGDRTVLTMRQGRVVFDEIKIMHGADGPQVAGEVARRIIEKKIARVFIDEIGVGYSVLDTLVHAGFGKVVQGVNSSSRDGLRKGYYNLRAQMWDLMRQWLVEEGGRLPLINGLEDELCAPSYEYRAADNLMLLESKDDVKARLGFSPDLADSIALTFAGPVPLEKSLTDGVRARAGMQRGGAHMPTLQNRDDWRSFRG
jgi:phage terminase large subunit